MNARELIVSDIEKDQSLLNESINKLRSLIAPKHPYDRDENNSKEVQIYEAYCHFNWLLTLCSNYKFGEHFDTMKYHQRFQNGNINQIIQNLTKGLNQ